MVVDLSGEHPRASHVHGLARGQHRTYRRERADGHHSISHHQNRAEKMEKNVRIQTFNVNMFAAFVEKLKNTPTATALCSTTSSALRHQHE